MQFSTLLAAVVALSATSALAMPQNYGYDGKPLDASFCRNAGPRESECRKDVETCDKKYDNEGRESQCVKNVRDKYRNKDKNYNYNKDNNKDYNKDWNKDKDYNKDWNKDKDYNKDWNKNNDWNKNGDYNNNGGTRGY